MNDKEFGQKIRRLREEEGITREEFCQDEVELSVRQLARIEAGTCKPTLQKISYIATRLGKGLYELMPDYVGLPARYTKLKYEIIRTPTYGKQDLVEKRDSALMEIYEDYYEDLPEEEKLAMDVIQSRIDVFEAESTDFGRDILEDYFEQVHRKKEYELNDLLILQLFAEFTRVSDRGSKEFLVFEKMLEKLLGQVERVAPDNLFVLRDVLFISVGILGDRKRHEKIPELFTAVEKIMEITHDFQKKPILNMLKWKYELYVNKNKEMAQEYYEEAVLFAKMIGNTFLAEKLKKSWKEEEK